MADAEAICEAVTQPNMHFVPIKTPEEQGVLILHRTRKMSAHAADEWDHGSDPADRIGRRTNRDLDPAAAAEETCAGCNRGDRQQDGAGRLGRDAERRGIPQARHGLGPNAARQRAV